MRGGIVAQVDRKINNRNERVKYFRDTAIVKTGWGLIKLSGHKSSSFTISYLNESLPHFIRKLYKEINHPTQQKMATFP